MKVYMILFDWSTTDDEAVEVELFDSYKKALHRFDEIIYNECDADMSWVGSQVFNEDGEVNEDFELETNANDIADDDNVEYQMWWNVTDRNDWNIHDFLDLKIMEVK